MSASLPGFTEAKVQRQIYLGVWTDWSRGPIMGVTLTLKRAQGSLLIAFTAFFIGLVASCFWRILVLLIQRIYSTPEPRDALHHQRQALLRNSVTAPSSLWAFSQLYWAWRRRGARQSLPRTLPVILCALLTIVLFAVAGGYSSQISSAVGNAALLDGSRCGLLRDSDNATEFHAVAMPYRVRLNADAANYAQQCYAGQSTGILDCATFVKRSLPMKINAQAPCPFDSEICRSNTSNLELDSGYIDSHEHLGINYPPENRILSRFVLQCAPLETAGYCRNVSTPSRNYTQYYYGPLWSGGDYTCQARTLDEQYDRLSQETTHASSYPGFSLNHVVSRTDNGQIYQTSDFHPIPEIFRPDGDVSILFLSGNGAFFLQPTRDPWYRVTLGGTTGTALSDGGGNDTFPVYQMEEAASPLACFEQYQFCNTFNHCGVLGSAADAGASAKRHLNSSVLRTKNLTDTIRIDPFELFYSALGRGLITFHEQIKNLRGNSLLSQQAFSNGLIGALPDNQWQLDIIHLWSTALAATQASFVHTASGPTDPAMEKYIRRLNEPYVCRNQILSTNFTSFSMFGLCLTYITGVIIIIVSYALEPVLYYTRRWRNPKQFTFLEWQTSQTLQLQGAAYQGIGSGGWMDCTEAIPTTEGDQVLADLSTFYTSACDGDKRVGKEDQGNNVNSLAQLDPAGRSDGSSQHQESRLQQSLLEENAEGSRSRPGSSSSSHRAATDSAQAPSGVGEAVEPTSSTVQRNSTARSL
ncbi:hypothetical protein CP532_5591 [Ophiocordyceps camponoti-leonardi (nom. inval.)]|nr:hypothetical protein CP532_5591 [Ophiocordyceps camponoti-leonardi (nom. inval.)]